MPIVARDLDVSEKKVVFHQLFAGLSNQITGGITLPFLVMPFPFELVSVGSAVIGMTGTINLQLQNYRNAVGVGPTMFGAMNSSFALAALGTSGSQYAMSNGSTQLVGWSLPAAGATILQGLPGDVLTLVGVGTGTITGNCTVTVVVKKLQDIAAHFGIST